MSCRDLILCFHQDHRPRRDSPSGREEVISGRILRMADALRITPTPFLLASTLSSMPTNIWRTLERSRTFTVMGEFPPGPEARALDDDLRFGADQQRERI